MYSDLDGQLLGEYNASGQPIREYIYLEGERVAMYDYNTVEPKDSSGQKAIVYLHNNQVGQVQYAFNSDGQMIYERIQTPFGETMGELNAYGMQVPVRFPGQYYDSETGFNQNWNRDYDPSLGRYVQSDPIGLRGGINTYGYVGQRPVVFTDILGLAPYVRYGSWGEANREALFDVMTLGMADDMEWSYRIFQDDSGECPMWYYILSSNGEPTWTTPPAAPAGSNPQGAGHNHPRPDSHLSDKTNSASGGSGDKGWADKTQWAHKRPEPVLMVDEGGKVEAYYPNEQGDDMRGETKVWPTIGNVPDAFPF